MEAWSRRQVHVGIPKRVPVSIVEIQFEFHSWSLTGNRAIGPVKTGGMLNGITLIGRDSTVHEELPRRLSVSSSIDEAHVQQAAYQQLCLLPVRDHQRMRK